MQLRSKEEANVIKKTANIWPTQRGQTDGAEGSTKERKERITK
jgi:metal-dependent amidase/aminoacylase/carboxypeptidase family protein